MAVIGDLASVLRDIRTKTDNIIIDPIWREVNGLDNEQAASAAKDRRINKRKSLLLMNALDDAKKNERKANPTDQAPVDKCKMVVFETPKDLKSFAFDKEKPTIPPMAAPKKSGLSKMIGNVALTDMKVFVPHMTKPIVIKIAQTATFEKLMEMVIRKVNSMDPNNQLNEDTDAYVLRMADEKGNVDDDFPGKQKYLRHYYTVTNYDIQLFIIYRNLNLIFLNSYKDFLFDLPRLTNSGLQKYPPGHKSVNLMRHWYYERMPSIKVR